MSERPVPAVRRLDRRLSAAAAFRLEIGIIALGVTSLLLIFQPFSLLLFGIGCGLVVFGGLINNLLPLCRAGATARTLIRGALIVALVFAIVLLLAICAAYLYGVWFVNAITPDTSEPFYLQPFVWCVAAVAAGLGALLAALQGARR